MAWQQTTIGEQVLLQRGMDITKAEQRPGSVPVISSGGVSSWHDTAGVRGPGVVLGRKGFVGSVWFTSADYWPHDTTLYVRDFKGNDPRFVYYFFRHKAPLLASLDVGSANPTLNRNHVHPTPVLWPSLPEQCAIAELLGALDDKIDLNRRMNDTLEETARALFKSWFVDFDPVQAKARGRQPFGMDATTAALFPATFENGALGEVPKGWQCTSLAEVADLNPESWTRPTYPNSIEYVDLANTKWGRIEATTSYSREEAPSRAQRVLRKGDTIVGTVRPGNGSFALVMQDGLTGSTGFAVLRPRLPNAVGFVYLSATRRENIMTLARLADGGAYPAVRPEVVIQQPAVVPPDAVQGVFARVVDPLLGRCAQADGESQGLVELRDYLLPKLLSGEVHVRDGEKFVEAAT